ncbi:hypothetical protein C8R41DRAFT_864417 [Lentinula lateritia]|uniref:F-box domain-containing protein n=1 Tax=Lentinula lateritia TaxID=40482 RepID=A0ABQ8VWJ5_9AGAR|nr:hypothetical protein C8R41DRAFT_864417 [Lentinula lateritia]
MSMSSTTTATVNPPPLSITPVDIIDEILEYLVNDALSLYRLGICSKTWCRSTLPILYRTSTTLALPTLSSNSPFTQKMLGVHPANFVRQLLIYTEDHERCVQQHFRDAVMNIDIYSQKELTHFNYISDDLSLHDVWNDYIPNSLRIENITLNCPLQRQTPQVLSLFSLCTKKITFNWKYITHPTSYTAIATLLPLLSNTSSRITSLHLAIPHILDVTDSELLQSVLDSDQFHFPQLAEFYLEEFLADILITPFLRRHPTIRMLAATWLHAGDADEEIKAGTLLHNLTGFDGLPVDAGHLTTIISTPLRTLELRGPSSNIVDDTLISTETLQTNCLEFYSTYSAAIEKQSFKHSEHTAAAINYN